VTRKHIGRQPSLTSRGADFATGEKRSTTAGQGNPDRLSRFAALEVLDDDAAEHALTLVVLRGHRRARGALGKE